MKSRLHPLGGLALLFLLAPITTSCVSFEPQPVHVHCDDANEVEAGFWLAVAIVHFLSAVAD